MKKLLLKLVNVFGLYTKYQILDEVSEVIELIVSLDENISTKEEEKAKQEEYMDMYLDFKSDMC